ncbi:MAG TPA: alpha/beta hydrolase [Pirellulaceae bacterium]|nr:alpha/beta hydrolase [Pirellulaceae bacterium]
MMRRFWKLATLVAMMVLAICVFDGFASKCGGAVTSRWADDGTATTLKRQLPTDPPYRVTRKYGVTFRPLPQRDLKCDLYLPEGEGPFPGVLVIHGGAWAWGSKSHYVHHARKICEQGYVVMAINYRLAPTHPFPAQVLDSQYAVRWLRHHAAEYRVDRQRIAAFGYSAGGHLACLLGTADDSQFVDLDLPEELARHSPKVSVVVAGGAVCDFDWIPESSHKLAYWMGGTRDKLPLTYRQASPRHHITAGDAAFFLYHGTRDQVVPFDCSRRMHEALLKAGCHSELHDLENYEHFQGFLDRAIIDDAIEFLKRQWPDPQNP